jgi:hypothetical protein
MRDAPFTLDAAATRYLTETLESFDFKNMGLAVCLASPDYHSMYLAHSIDLCGWGDNAPSDSELCNVLGRPLWIEAREVKLLTGRVLTVIKAGEPKKRARLVIKGISEYEVRAALCGGAQS